MIPHRARDQPVTIPKIGIFSSCDGGLPSVITLADANFPSENDVLRLVTTFVTTLKIGIFLSPDRWLREFLLLEGENKTPSPPHYPNRAVRSLG
jgi:hypothetical protein